MVFNHLKYLACEVYVGKIENKEIDFVTFKDNKTIYVQTAYGIAEKNRKREFEDRLEIKDNYEKIVVSMDVMIDEHDNYQGIKHLNIRNFLSREI